MIDARHVIQYSTERLVPRIVINALCGHPSIRMNFVYLCEFYVHPQLEVVFHK